MIDCRRRCRVNAATRILCADDALLSGATCGAGLPKDAMVALANRAVKCGAGNFASKETSGACQEGCAACRDGASCDICDGTTRRTDGTCAATAGAAAETHNGVVACDAEHFLADGSVCTPCSGTKFGDACTRCTAVNALRAQKAMSMTAGCAAGQRRVQRPMGRGALRASRGASRSTR